MCIVAGLLQALVRHACNNSVHNVTLVRRDVPHEAQYTRMSAIKKKNTETHTHMNQSMSEY
jgi:hypothetical protein